MSMRLLRGAMPGPQTWLVALTWLLVLMTEARIVQWTDGGTIGAGRCGGAAVGRWAPPPAAWAAGP